jgi:hypothetical protein
LFVQYSVFLGWVTTFGLALLIVFIADLAQRFRTFERRISAGFQKLSIPFMLADADLLHVYRRFAVAVMKIAEHQDPLFRELAAFDLTAMAADLERLARGTVVFSGTETWRAAYQKLLLTLNVQSYFSVAWVRTDDYWNDPPGKQSMQLNFDLVERGFHIQRIHILPDQLWPANEEAPLRHISDWLETQATRGINVHVVRERDLTSEPDLLQDFAIYGDRATAIQELDQRSRTARFVLSFDRGSIRQAFNRWERISLYAKIWETGVDRKDRRCVG